MGPRSGLQLVEISILGLLVIEPRFLGCAAGSSVVVPSEVNRLKVEGRNNIKMCPKIGCKVMAWIEPNGGEVLRSVVSEVINLQFLNSGRFLAHMSS